MPHGCPKWSFNLTGDEEEIIFQLVIRPLKQRVLVHEIGKIDTMKSYVYGSKKPSSLPTILKLCMSNIAPSPSVGFDVQKKISRTVGVKPDKSEHATRKEKLGTQRCRADCVPVSQVPQGHYPSRPNLQFSADARGGTISWRGSPHGSQTSEVTTNSQHFTWKLMDCPLG